MENGDETLGENGDAEGMTGMHVNEDPELEAIKARVREMEEEAEKLKQMQTEVDKQMNLGSPPATAAAGLNLSFEEKVEVDNRSIYVGNVDYFTSDDELKAHFHGCGLINRVTIPGDRVHNHPRGFAYIEFADKDSVQSALAMDESLFRGRQIKVNLKRTNRPGMSSTNRFRGRRYPLGTYFAVMGPVPNR